MQIKHIFFDLDHTLWDFETNSGKTFEFILKRNNIKVDLNEFLEIYRPINQQYWRLYREEKISKSELRYGRLKNAFDKLNYNTDDSLINLLSKEYIDFLPNYNTLFDGAIEILKYLELKYILHIITNGFDEIQSLKLEKSGIRKYFNRIITSESIGVKKPNPKIFSHALEITSALPDESIMIGDNIEADILGAMNVGIQAIHCNFDNQTNNNNIISINKLNELKQYL